MTSQSAATLRSRYVEQAASDLEENRRRQQELAEKIKMLKQEEGLLVDILTLAERYDATSDPSRLPEQAQGEPALTPEAPESGLRTAAAGTPTRRTTAGSPVARAGRSTPRTAAKGKSRQPLLGDLLRELLGAYEEPRLAKELRDELLEKHPDRNPTPQVVRNTLEALVAKGRIRRHKQQRSVMYSLVEPVDRQTAAADDDASPHG
ncbi:hypothetical protein ACFPC0_24015 [Streptomyces andamanensis]|uniref:BlaI/MecI/CopY family transcriptional regulator n=1 Tax=Streptomyces andamanensis TaxID=1565035 RepID=A0ABV8TJB9_9ACTN